MNAKTVFTLVCLLGGMLLLAACRAAPTTTGALTVDVTANGELVELPQDQLLIVQLQSNPSTGYSWGVIECDLSVLQPLGDPEYVSSQPGKQVTGGGGWEVFRFQPQAAGQTHLKMGYRRPWEQDVEPVETFEIDVVVQ